MFHLSMLGIGILGVIEMTLFYFQRKEIKNIQEQLEAFKTVTTNQKITLSGPNKELEKLLFLINERIDKEKETAIFYENKERQLREVIANVSHDLRTPLTSIIGYLQLMEDESLSQVQCQSYSDIVRKRAASLETLISSFYDLSRLEADEYQFELTSLKLAPMLCELVASFYNDFVIKGLEPSIEMDEQVPSVIGDEKAVHRIFNNLIQNLLKHGKGQVQILLRQEENFVITEFINDAEGLKKEEVAQLFERFFTADRMRTGQNTGLGLAITKNLVEQMGHSICAELKENRLHICIKWHIKNTHIV